MRNEKQQTSSLKGQFSSSPILYVTQAFLRCYHFLLISIQDIQGQNQRLTYFRLLLLIKTDKFQHQNYRVHTAIAGVTPCLLKR